MGFIFKGFEATGYHSDSYAIRGVVFKEEDENIIEEAFDFNRDSFCGLDGKHSEVTGEEVEYTYFENILDCIFDDCYQNCPEDMLNYEWVNENPEKADEIIQMNEEIREKCSIETVKKYIIPEEFKD